MSFRPVSAQLPLCLSFGLIHPFHLVHQAGLVLQDSGYGSEFLGVEGQSFSAASCTAAAGAWVRSSRSNAYSSPPAPPVYLVVFVGAASPAPTVPPTALLRILADSWKCDGKWLWQFEWGPVLEFGWGPLRGPAQYVNNSAAVTIRWRVLPERPAFQEWKFACVMACYSQDVEGHQ
jgi:hypothetical protein